MSCYLTLASIVFHMYMVFVAFQTVLEAFKEMLPPRATVIRSGRRIELLANDLTVGDIVMLSPGAQAPADLRVIQANDLSIDKSALTGESHAVPVGPMVQDPAISALEASNLVLLGTRIVEGNGWGIVIRVGSQCIMSGIARMASGPSQKTTLHKEINRFVRMIVGAAIVTAAVFFIAWGAWLRTSYPKTETTPAFQAPADIVVNVVGAIVAFIPEGLPVAVTMTLTIIAKKLVKRYRLVVTQLGVVETLGCVTLIASDKTGTLTQNAMALRTMCVNIGHKDKDHTNTAAMDFSVDTSRIDCTQLHRPITSDAQLPIIHMLLRDSVLCNVSAILMCLPYYYGLTRSALLFVYSQLKCPQRIQH
jgi:sodium/potassium-transporting ATPase subunit alpha